MIRKSNYPIFEFDDNSVAKLNPISLADQSFNTDKLIITFFPEVMDTLVTEGKITLERTIRGENPVCVYRFLGDDILITLGQVGCPACAGNLDLLNAMGIARVMFCGGGGVLTKHRSGPNSRSGWSNSGRGFFLPLRRTFKIYLYRSRDHGKNTQFLTENSVSYIRGLTWTTDAIFRETADRIARRKEEGAKDCRNGAGRMHRCFTIQRF